MQENSMRSCSRAFALTITFVLALATIIAQTTAQAIATKSSNGGDPNGGTRLLRNPSMSATSIAFEYGNDIWVAPKTGGDARRITSFQGQETDPHFSPDGRFLAFSAQYGGNTDVYVVPAEGGEPKRLTWHPGADGVTGWTHDSR
ncbi:MAG: hypothetical protein ACRENP_23905, partial [Longimicrobiales bacterium]